MPQSNRHLRRMLIILPLVLAALDLFFTNFHYSSFLPCLPFDPQYEKARLTPKEELGSMM